MNRIDFYIQHLMRHQALAVELSSGNPVRFRFASGGRASTTIIEHAQIAELIQEVAPEGGVQELLRRGKVSFPYKSKSGDFSVHGEATGPTAWRVIIAPGTCPQSFPETTQKASPPTTSPVSQKEKVPEPSKTSQDRAATTTVC